jgi:protein SCO1
MLAPIVLLLGLAATLNGCGSQQASGAPILKKTGLPFMGSDIPTPYAGANFALHDHRGRTYTLNQFRGRVVLVTFLHTHCPDTCPLITEALNQALRDLGSTRSQSFHFSLPENDFGNYIIERAQQDCLRRPLR